MAKKPRSRSVPRGKKRKGTAKRYYTGGYQA